MLDSPSDEVKMPPRENETENSETKNEENKDYNLNDEDDAETAELSRLRCTSIRTEEIAEKQQRRADRRNRCADYPGLAFGSAAFGSETMMK